MIWKIKSKGKSHAADKDEIQDEVFDEVAYQFWSEAQLEFEESEEDQAQYDQQGADGLDVQPEDVTNVQQQTSIVPPTIDTRQSIKVRTSSTRYSSNEYRKVQD
ncbi:hypothetical protein AKJ16_DCAP09735 [Drosera capensis]